VWASFAASTSQDFIADQLARWKPATAHNRYRQLRHAFATTWLAEGGNENDLMVAGWKSRIMIDRSPKATAVEWARASHARLSPGDRL
jgi:hypothetical protein